MVKPLLDLNAEPFTVRVTRRPPTVRLSLLGELDVAGADRLADVVEEVAAEVEAAGPAPETVWVDLGGLMFVDLVGARALARACDRLSGLGAAVEVSGVGRSIERILELTGVGLPGVNGPATAPPPAGSGA